MQYTRLGNTGLEVSRICVGCMQFGEPDRGTQKWTLGEPESRAIIKASLDAGINFFDTANVYSAGSSEEITGRALNDMVPRHEVVMATKVHGRMREGPNGAGQSRAAIMYEIDQSLKRLGTDYVDLYQIHRYDPATPMEETLEALHDVVKAGKARYVGASSMWAWQFMKMLGLQRLHGWARFVSMQNHVNLLHREEEREMLPLCAAEGIGVIPWSPYARGRLTRPWGTATKRTEVDQFARDLYVADHAPSKRIVERVAKIAARHGVSMATVALAWVLQKPAVTAPIVGFGNQDQVTDAVAALELDLSAREIAQLEAPYRPQVPVGFH